MSQSFRFEQVFTPDIHDALWDWAQTSYGASTIGAFCISTACL